MALLKVGQRVRIKVPGPGVQQDHGFTPAAGKEGIIIGYGSFGYWMVAVFTVPPPKSGKPGWLIPGCELEPLTKPGVDAWAAQQVKKLVTFKPLVEAEPVTTEHGTALFPK